MKTLLSTALAVSCMVSSSNAEFNFRGPQIMELDKNTQGMTLSDLDNDGRTDLILINNKEMKLECLYQRTKEELDKEIKSSINNSYIQPVYSDLPFLRKQKLLGEFAFALNTIDLDNDGKRDIVYTGKTSKLSLLFQSEDGKWNESWNDDESEMLEYGGTLSVADLNSDGKEDLAVLTKGSIKIYLNNGSRDRPIPATYAVSVDDAQNLKMVDVNEDGLLDLVYFSKFHPYAMRFRLQKKNSRFGAEIAVPVKTSSTDWQVFNDAGKPFQLATINKNSAEVDIQSVNTEAANAGANKFLQAHMFHVPTAGKLSAVYTLGDFNGDKLPDIVAADPNGASLYLYQRAQDGSFLPPRQYATYSNVNSLSKVRLANAEKDSLLICSGKEQIVGISSYNENSFEFPKNIGFSGSIILSASIDVNDDDNEEIVVLEQSGRRYKMHVLNLDDDDLSFEIPLGSLQREPTHFITKDFNNDGATDIALITPRDYMRVYLRNEDQQFTEFTDESGLLQGQFSDILPSQINVFDYNGDGKQEWILTQKGYMRSYRIEGDKLVIVGQSNTREEGDDIRGPIAMQTKEGEQSLYSYDLKNLSMQIFNKKDDGVLRYSHMSKIGKIDLQYSVIDEGKDAAALVFGRHSFWYIPMENQIYANKVINSLSSNLKKADYQHIAIDDFNNDKKKDIIAIDGVDGFIEMFSWNEKKSEWVSQLHFKIFESSDTQRGRKGLSQFEPREISVADFNNDGKTDIALLCHDKVLVYTQK